MPQFETRRRVRHSVGNMFDLVADVERYPEFVPLCEALVVKRREREGECDVLTVTMTVAYKLFREHFTSRVVLDREAGQIRVSYQDGPFRFLENCWTFRELGADSCEVEFRISYEFRSKLLASLMGTVFDHAFRKFAVAFEERADKLYGKHPPAPHAVKGPPPGGAV
jgi:coenzyme Q-binding protein COQ10